MNTLYVDTDDTLITWCPEGCQHEMHPFGAGANHWRANVDVVAVMAQWQGPIVVWSGGGAAWAEDMATRALAPELLNRITRFEGKWPVLPQSGDLFIDDDPLDTFAPRTVHPHDCDAQAALS